MEAKYRYGPIKFEDRKCTDIFCNIFFVVYLVVLVYISQYSMNNGSPDKLNVPYDPDRIFIILNFKRSAMR